MKELWEDQRSAIDRMDALLANGKRRIVIQAPTGYGKTLVATSILQRELDQSRRVLFIVPALSLIDQTVQVFQKQGIDDIGVIQSYNEMTNWDMPVQVASVQTLMRRNVPLSSFIIIDEVHKWWNFYEKLLLDEKWKETPIIGLSATPWTKGLGAYFSDLLIAGTTQEMIDKGRLSDFKVYAPHSPDLKGVRTVAGDYHEGDLGRAMNKATLVADIVSTWQRLGQDRPTLCFAVDRAHAKAIQNQFVAAGITAGYQDAYTKDDERRMLKARFHGGEIKVVCNVGTLTTGVDWDVRCIILARPTKSEMLFVQIVGRGLRTAEGKDHCLLLDHSDNHLRLGFVTDIQHDILSDGTKAVSGKADGIRLPKKCPQCSYLKPPKASICPACGFKTEAQARVEVKSGKLVELRRTKAEERALEAAEAMAGSVWGDKRAVYVQLLTLARLKGKKDGWAYYQFKEIYNEDPPWIWKGDPPIEPHPEVSNWIIHRHIAKNAWRTK